MIHDLVTSVLVAFAAVTASDMSYSTGYGNTADVLLTRRRSRVGARCPGVSPQLRCRGAIRPALIALSRCR